jgi:hypothetical protein
MDELFIRCMGNVIFCCKDTFSLEEFLHCLLHNISNDYTVT